MTPAMIDRYWQTLRYLKPEQIAGRLRFRLGRPRIERRPAPPCRPPPSRWQAPACRGPSLAGPGAFVFLNQPGHLDTILWDGPERDPLWRYNQHYFDDLNAQAADARTDWHRALLNDWVVRVPAGEGTGWEPYPTSLRIVNWIKWAWRGHTLTPACLDSLAIQARWLRRRLEWHLLGNHLFANAKALIFAGFFFQGPEADRWRACGLRILGRQVPEQILLDGGQFELSPMYHALALEDMLDLANLALSYPAALSDEEQALMTAWAARLPDMVAWLQAMCHPDGDIAFFNDAAFGIAPAPAALKGYADRLGVISPAAETGPIHWLAESGYARLCQGEAVLLCDLARIGPDYLPGHAHADTLSFEVSLYGQRLLVNSGTSVYGTGAERQRQRGTAAHNTVVVANADSSEVWSGFRVARRARPYAVQVGRDGHHLRAEGAHDGYHRLPGRPAHHRQWRLSPGALDVDDWLTGAMPAEDTPAAEARFHLHPGIAIRLDGPDCGTCHLAAGQVAHWRAGGGPVRLDTTSWHPAFGVSRANRCLVVPLHRGRASFQLRWGR